MATTTVTRCGYDTGSMYGCEPACSAPASQSFTYSTPCYGSFTVPLCERHVPSMRGRVYPDTVESVTPLD